MFIRDKTIYSLVCTSDGIDVLLKFLDTKGVTYALKKFDERLHIYVGMNGNEYNTIVIFSDRKGIQVNDMFNLGIVDFLNNIQSELRNKLISNIV